MKLLTTSENLVSLLSCNLTLCLLGIYGFLHNDWIHLLISDLLLFNFVKGEKRACRELLLLPVHFLVVLSCCLNRDPNYFPTQRLCVHTTYILPANWDVTWVCSFFPRFLHFGFTGGKGAEWAWYVGGEGRGNLVVGFVGCFAEPRCLVHVQQIK